MDSKYNSPTKHASKKDFESRAQKVRSLEKEGLKNREIAHEMTCSPSAMRSVRYRIREGDKRYDNTVVAGLEVVSKGINEGLLIHDSIYGTMLENVNTRYGSRKQKMVTDKGSLSKSFSLIESRAKKHTSNEYSSEPETDRKSKKQRRIESKPGSNAATTFADDTSDLPMSSTSCCDRSVPTSDKPNAESTPKNAKKARKVKSATPRKSLKPRKLHTNLQAARDEDTRPFNSFSQDSELPSPPNEVTLQDSGYTELPISCTAPMISDECVRSLSPIFSPIAEDRNVPLDCDDSALDDVDVSEYLNNNFDVMLHGVPVLANQIDENRNEPERTFAPEISIELNPGFSPTPLQSQDQNDVSIVPESSLSDSVSFSSHVAVPQDTEVLLRETISNWSVEQVGAWVSRIKRTSRDWSAVFQQENIFGDVLLSLTEDDLKAIGINKLGDRRVILSALNALL